MPRRANPMATQTRGGNGKFTRTAESRKRDHKAAELHGQGYSYQRIADELGFASKGHAHNAVMRAFAEIPTEGSAEAKRLDLERLDRLIEWNWQVMVKPHLAHSNGRVIRHFVDVERDEDGIERLDMDGKTIPVFEDVLDDGPGQSSAREIRALTGQRARIFGYEAPVKHEHEVRTISEIDARLIELAEEMAPVEPGRPEAVPCPSK